MRSRHIQVARPLLPSAAELYPYLEQIDESRHYANHGRLVSMLEDRLATALKISAQEIAIASSGTAALEAAILASAGRATEQKQLAVMPSYTFSATALAAIRCGYEPYFVDVDDETWSLDVDQVAALSNLGSVGVVISVAPYGRLPNIKDLESLSDDTGIPVVLDAAASFEQLYARPYQLSSKVATVVSFHATKSLSTGEGGAVFWLDRDGAAKTEHILNFGFAGERESSLLGFNGKLSEYHAAIGLAMLDTWPARLETAYALNKRLQEIAADELNDHSGSIISFPQVSSCYALYLGRSETTTNQVELYLEARRIDSRRWYERGLHKQSVFRNYGRSTLENTNRLSGRLLGIPCSIDLPEDDMRRILRVIGRAVSVPQYKTRTKETGLSRVSAPTPNLF